MVHFLLLSLAWPSTNQSYLQLSESDTLSPISRAFCGNILFSPFFFLLIHTYIHPPKSAQKPPLVTHVPLRVPKAPYCLFTIFPMVGWGWAVTLFSATTEPGTVLGTEEILIINIYWMNDYKLSASWFRAAKPNSSCEGEMGQLG